jgi:hypothetical protein
VRAEDEIMATVMSMHWPEVTKEQFDSFVQNRLAAGVAAAGISSQPKVEFADSLSVYAPNV